MKHIDKNNTNLDILTRYGHMLKHFPGMKKPISEVKKENNGYTIST